MTDPVLASRKTYADFAVHIAGSFPRYVTTWLSANNERLASCRVALKPPAAFRLARPGVWAASSARALKAIGRVLARLALPHQLPDDGPLMDFTLRDQFLAAVDEAGFHDSHGVRLRLLVEAPDLQDLPWELLHLPDLGFVALRPDVSLVRTRGGRVPENTPLQREGTVEVALVANTCGLRFPASCKDRPLGLDRVPEAAMVMNRVSQIFEPYHGSGIVVIGTWNNLPRAHLQAEMRNLPRVIVSFGHGVTLDSNGCPCDDPYAPGAKGCLVVPIPRAGSEPIPLREITGWTKGVSPGLWILFHCHLARHAAAFMTDSTRAVLAMQSLLTVQGGQLVEDFCAWLLSTEGDALENAVSFLRRRLASLERKMAQQQLGKDGLPDWCTPVLYLQASESGFA